MDPLTAYWINTMNVTYNANTILIEEAIGTLLTNAVRQDVERMADCAAEITGADISQDYSNNSAAIQTNALSAYEDEDKQKAVLELFIRQVKKSINRMDDLVNRVNAVYNENQRR